MFSGEIERDHAGIKGRRSAARASSLVHTYRASARKTKGAAWLDDLLNSIFISDIS